MGDSDVWIPTGGMAVGVTGSYEENVTRATDRPSREDSFKQAICMAAIQKISRFPIDRSVD